MNAELAKAVWFKSSHSGPNADCVEVTHLDEGSIGVRDSKNPDGGALIFGSEEWHTFIAGVRAGEFD